MKKITLIVFTIIIAIILQSCMGLPRVSDSQKYFKSKIAEDFKDRKLEKIGIYVFSSGGTVDKVNDAGISTVTGGRIVAGNPYSTAITLSDFVDIIEPDSEFYPDTSNTGPSTELAMEISKELKIKGFKPKIYEDLGHKGDIKFEQIVEHAKSQGMEAAFIVHYSSLSSFSIMPEIEKGIFGINFAKGGVQNFKGYSGFIYLPSAVIFDLNTNKIIWSFSNYGIVQNAHYFNFGNDFQKVIPITLTEYIEDSYLKASVKAKEMIFEPMHWKDTYKPIPDLKTRKRKL